MLGVFLESLVEPMAEVLKNLGIKKAMVVHGYDGLDEITLTTKTKVCEINEGKLSKYDIDPQVYGFKLCGIDELKGGDATYNAGIIKDLLNGERRITSYNVCYTKLLRYSVYDKQANR